MRQTCSRRTVVHISCLSTQRKFKFRQLCLLFEQVIFAFCYRRIVIYGRKIWSEMEMSLALLPHPLPELCFLCTFLLRHLLVFIFVCDRWNGGWGGGEAGRMGTRVRQVWPISYAIVEMCCYRHKIFITYDATWGTRKIIWCLPHHRCCRTSAGRFE